MPRPKINIDWKHVTELLKAQCDNHAIARQLGCSPDIIYKKCAEDNGVSWQEFAQSKKADGKEALRKKMYDIALNGNVTMCIWLSKQYLGFTDKVEKQLSSDENMLIINVIKPDQKDVKDD